VPFTTLTTHVGDTARPRVNGGRLVDLELSRQAFYEAWKHFKLGTIPLVLNVFPEGVLESERREAEKRAWDELRRVGFGNRDDEDDIYSAMLPLQRYEYAFDITYRHITEGERRRRTGMVANVRANATLAVLGDESVQLATLRTDAMTRALLSVLPDVQAGPGKAVSVRSKQLDTAAKDAGTSNRAMQEGLMRQGVRRDDARALVEMAGVERVAFAQIGASMMDNRGRYGRAPMVTNCFATTQGWYLIEESRRSSEAWTTIAPIDKPRMGSRVRDLLKTISAD
jgi:hypothetical protein